MAELCAAGEAELGVRLEPGALARLAAYGRSVAHFPTAVKELEWRNGWFDAISQAALAPQPSPVRPPPRLAAAAPWLLPPLSWSTTPVLACNPAVISQAAVAGGRPDPVPLHTAGLQKLGVI